MYQEPAYGRFRVQDLGYSNNRILFLIFLEEKS